MSRIIIEGLTRKTNLGKTKSEIMYDLVRSNAGNTNISTEDIVRRSVRIYDNMVDIGMIKEYPDTAGCSSSDYNSYSEFMRAMSLEQ